MDKDHVLKTPDDCDCSKYDICLVCDGGLSVCKICGKAEIELQEPCETKTEEK